MSIIGINSGENRENYLYVKDSPLACASGIEIQKQNIYDIPIIYSGTETNVYGILYVDEKIISDCRYRDIGCIIIYDLLKKKRIENYEY